MITQYAALPFRRSDCGLLEILLVTSRETARWVIPKGNPMRGLDGPETAAQEAVEEAGVEGRIAPEPLGAYRYEKNRRRRGWTRAEVHVFPMLVEREAATWQEQGQRERRWFTSAEAAEAVAEPGLKALILHLASEPAARHNPSALIRPRPFLKGKRMLKLFHAIMPKEGSFFEQFTRHAETLVGGARVMSRMFAREEAIEESCRRIAELETEADGITREVLHSVRRTFITPFDRSAITDLISSMDDAIDEMQKTAKAITLFETETFEPQMREMAALAEQAARLVLEAIPLLRSIGRNHAALDRLTERIVHLEEEADHLHDAGLKALFQTSREGNAMDYIVGREIYSHLEKILDRLEDVANEIQGIVIDHA